MGSHILNRGNIRKTINYIRKNGIKNTYYAAAERLTEEKEEDYFYREPDETILNKQQKDGKRFPYRFSIVVPAYETKEKHFREMLDSVRRQSYERWELIIADAGKSSTVGEIVAEYQEKQHERRLRYIRLTENRGISENTNAGIAAAEGDYIALLDHDDFLAPDALYEMACAIQRSESEGRKPVMLYSDEDKFDDSDRYFKEPNRKYKFNFDMILSNNYICHLMVVNAGWMKNMKLRGQYDGAQDYDLVLRIVSGLMEDFPIRKLDEKIVHVPRTLYHWRSHADSTALNTASKSYAYEAGKAALEDFFRKMRWEAKVSHALHLGFYKTEYLPDMFAVRSDVGIIGGKVIDSRNKIASGIYSENGDRLYKGVHKNYSGGRTHRAALMQDCAAVDIRCIKVRKELQPIFEQIVGVKYRETEKCGFAEISPVSCDEEGYKKLSMELGRAAAERGYLVVWNPELSVKV